eukprot:CAMPEP_0175043190 /NCGR_PEP_ID=MMETSP0052_2-20121109/3024_1 /TAXON_ID=51329 ORGANISM="Polytomella parva, Strain SAG 63-3" /NCGR_SAMPLE_ID=MMETSP0052_2 /ASSEMBLY_ACC=CAM_ASM_000194 /LENGTH=45 /DNA_ID= /DNA_START= /DNA_END= /DNA_ORIENTATION=
MGLKEDWLKDDTGNLVGAQATSADRAVATVALARKAWEALFKAQP